MEDTKTHIISRELANYREADRCCPTCNDGTRIKQQQRWVPDEASGNPKFCGVFWVCVNHPDDTDHYQYSPGGGSRGAKPRETNGAVVPRKFLPPEPDKPRVMVVKRQPNGHRVPLRVA